MRRVLALAASCLVALAGVAGAASPRPGSAREVAGLVAVSGRITRLPQHLTPSVADASKDGTNSHFKSTNPNCTGATQCVFGDTASRRTAVLLGDSHARMWLAAMLPRIDAAHVRLVLMWYPQCPAARVTVWDNPHCDRWRSGAIATIRRLHPFLVLLSNWTNEFTSAGSTVPFTFTQWRAGLEATITAVASGATRVVVIGDVPTFDAPVPACLAANPTAVQRCSVPYPNPRAHQHQAAEMAAAKAEHVAYIDPRQWLCTKVCSPVIGRFIAYSDSNHLTFTYASYLSAVFGAALARDLR